MINLIWLKIIITRVIQPGSTNFASIASGPLGRPEGLTDSARARPEGQCRSCCHQFHERLHRRVLL
jgi:hypothetical protein